MAEDDLSERAKLIDELLEKMMPIPADALPEVREIMDRERRSLLYATGWHSLDIERLKVLLKK